ncbi:hypothetical protein L3X38_014284 [Prunus dulcis]|uniref:Uncharacterized protein n=1 Tax=Prunus dulcis TaxID=3755 RepID=A0AAD4ZHU6_PRUDU|nr:hypothetical protein L3X38_014284 [Prunus dulcis]
MSYQLDELKDFLKFRRMLLMNVDIMKRIIPVIIAYLRPRFTNKFTRSPANTTPRKFADTAAQNGISRMEAMMAPVHAHVPGKGTATNSIRPSYWNSSTRPAFSLALTYTKGSGFSKNPKGSGFSKKPKVSVFSKKPKEVASQRSQRKWLLKEAKG